MFCRFCGNSIPDGSGKCPICGAMLRTQSIRHTALCENPYEKPMAARYFFIPVFLGLFSSFFSIFSSLMIGRLSAFELAAVNSYMTGLSIMESLGALVRGFTAFLIAWRGREEQGKKILLIVSLVFAFVPALTAPWMLPLFQTSVSVSEMMPAFGVFVSLLIGAVLGSGLGLLLKPKTLWIYLAAAVFSLALLLILLSADGSYARMENEKDLWTVYMIFAVEYFAFYAFPSVGLSAAWFWYRKSYLMTVSDGAGRIFMVKVKDPTKIPADPERELPVPGFSVLGFFVPLAGLILYILWRNTFPGKARSAAKGAISGLAVSVFSGMMLTAIIRLLM